MYQDILVMESNRIEYKRELTDTLEKEVVALLNYHDGSAIHPGQDQDDFFAGYSMPRNKTLMRVFKDLDMVEYLGSGMPRILKAYSRESYIFSTHFIRTAFPVSQKALALEREVAGTTTEKSDQKELQESATGKDYRKRLQEKTTGKTTGKRHRRQYSQTVSHQPRHYYFRNGCKTGID
jgi:predicted HTH transcriptional regulator